MGHAGVGQTQRPSDTRWVWGFLFRFSPTPFLRKVLCASCSVPASPVCPACSLSLPLQAHHSGNLRARRLEPK